MLDIEAYVPGKSTAPGVARVFKLSSNETPLGPSPQAIAAYQAAADAPARVSRTAPRTDLREAIGRAFGLDPDRIVCGAGSDDLLNLLARAYLGDGDEAIHTTHGFLVYPIATLGTGAKPIVAPETNYTADVDAILTRVTPRTKMVFLANPEQSDRHLHPVRRGEAAARRRCRRNACSCSMRPMRSTCGATITKSGIELVATSSNVVMCRTFSKIYGLAALRLGWLYGPAHIVDALNRIRGPFNVNAPAIAAGIAAMQDTAHVETAREHNTRWLAWLTEEIGKLGLEVTPSVANFVLIHFPEPEGPHRQGRRCVPHRARPDPAPGRRLQAAQRAAHDASAAKRRTGWWCRRSPSSWGKRDRSVSTMTDGPCSTALP